MRRTAALVACFVLVVPGAASAEGAPQLAFQLGAVGQKNGELTRSAFTIDCIHSPFSYGAGWVEFGILQRDFADVRYPVTPYQPAPGNRGTALALSPELGLYLPQVLELSTGVLAGLPGHAVFPYLRAGAGVYHEEPMDGELPVPVPEDPVPPPAPLPSESEWGMGASLGAGARFHIKGVAASPTIEARLHFTRLDGDARHELYTVTGGFWFH
jgi:hypothetical protein